MLFFLAAVQLGHWYFHMSKMSNDLLDAATVNSALLGTAAAAGIAAFAPNLPFMK
jgi:hypothetical protein